MSTLRQQIDGRRQARRRRRPLDQLPADERPPIVKRYRCRKRGDQIYADELHWHQSTSDARGDTVHLFIGGLQGPETMTTPAWNWREARKAWKLYCQRANQPAEGT